MGEPTRSTVRQWGLSCGTGWGRVVSRGRRWLARSALKSGQSLWSVLFCRMGPGPGVGFYFRIRLRHAWFV